MPLNGQQYIAINGYEGKALALLESISCSSIKFEFACPVPERTGHVPQDLDWEEGVGASSPWPTKPSVWKVVSSEINRFSCSRNAIQKMDNITT